MKNQRGRGRLRTDELTQLPNRAFLLDQLDHAFRRKASGTCALICLNIDRFRHLNDVLGHAAGDAILKETALRIRATVRDSDIVARGNGDEFFILLNSLSSLSNIQRVAHKMLAAFERPLQLTHREHYLTFTLGVAVLQRDGANPEEVLGNAQMAAHRAKDRLGESLHFFSADMGRRIARNLSIEAGLRRALPAGELRLVYQPRVSMTDSRLTGYEALLRWDSEPLGAISPMEFIPVAEECGLIVPIGSWALRQACLQAKEWQSRGGNADGAKMAVNVSTLQFLDPGFVPGVLRLLDEMELDGSSLELEITESLLATDITLVNDIVARLRKSDVTVAIDDFGTGYCGLQYLKTLGANTLKIDRGFVRNLPEDSVDAAIAGAVIALGASIGMRVVAEGVETQQQWQCLARSACDEVQGYLISEPLAPSALESRFLARKQAIAIP